MKDYIPVVIVLALAVVGLIWMYGGVSLEMPGETKVGQATGRSGSLTTLRRVEAALSGDSDAAIAWKREASLMDCWLSKEDPYSDVRVLEGRGCPRYIDHMKKVKGLAMGQDPNKWNDLRTLAADILDKKAWAVKEGEQLSVHWAVVELALYFQKIDARITET